MIEGPRDAFEWFREMVLAGGSAGLETILADDCVVEIPFTPPGSVARFSSKETYVATIAEQQRGFFSRIRFVDVRVTAVHETIDPSIAVVEYEMEAERLADGFRASAAFVVVVGVREGWVVLWREYQNPLAMALVAA